MEEKMDEIRKIYAEEKARMETKEIAEIAQDTDKTLQTKLNSKLAEHIDKDESVAKKINATATKLVDKGLTVQDNKATASIIRSDDEILEADFEKNKAEYLYHGIDHKIDKAWKRKIVMFINDIWFIIWAIVSAFTIVPFSTFLSRIHALRGIIKGVAILVGVGLLLLLLYGIVKYVLGFFGINIL